MFGFIALILASGLILVSALSCVAHKRAQPVKPANIETALPLPSSMPAAISDKPSPQSVRVPAPSGREVTKIQPQEIATPPAAGAPVLPKPPAPKTKKAAASKGPVADPAVVTQNLPAARPIHNYTGPIPLETDVINSQQDAAGQNIPDFTPSPAAPLAGQNPDINNPPDTQDSPVSPAPSKFGGPQIPADTATKKLPPFRPVTNKTGPAAESQ